MTGAAPPVLAIDIGGTKVSASLVRPSGDSDWTEQWPMASLGSSPSALLAAVVGTAQRAACCDLSSVGIAIPAVLEADGVVRWSPNLPHWDGCDIPSTVKSILDVPVAVEYDGHASALGEAWLGAGAGCRDFVVVAVGTGIGCGVVSNGQVVRGATRLAGAAGWMVMDGAATWESLASSTAAQKLAASLAAPGAKREEVTPEAMFASARHGNAAASAAVGDLGRAVGIGVANLVSILNPARVILTGGLGSQPELLEAVRRSVHELAQPVSGESVEILTSPLGSASVLLGAAKAALCAIDSDPSGSVPRRSTQKGNNQ